MLIAGRNLLVEKSVAFSDFRVNAGGFEGARPRRGASERIMYRETERGLRYYVKEGDTRVVSERATRSARAMAMGVTLDPSYAFPLPIFGINYLNFEFRGPDSQLAILFAGVLAAGNIQRPKLGSHAVRRERGFLRDRGAVERSALRRRRRARGGAPADVAADDRRQSRLAVHAVPEADGAVSVPVRRLHARHDDVGDLRRAGEHHHQRLRRRLGVPPRRLQRVVNGAWFARAGWRRLGTRRRPALPSARAATT